MYVNYKRIIVGADVGVCDLMWWRKLENLGKITDVGQATTILKYVYLRSNPVTPGDKRVFYHCAIQAIFLL